MSFTYGRPVQPEEFVDREHILHRVLARIMTHRPVAIVGEPQCGKSSILVYLNNGVACRKHLSDSQAASLITSWIDLYPVPTTYTPYDFWSHALEPLVSRPGHATIAQSLRATREEGFSSYRLQRLVTQLHQRRKTLVLLLDEIEMLLFHPNFQDFSFFATLRSLSQPGFSPVITSRLSVAELNERGRELRGSGGSPLFNKYEEIWLEPFTHDVALQLLSRVGTRLSEEEKQFALTVAGHHPYLLQAMASALLECSGSDRAETAAQNFYDGIAAPHFDTLWRSLGDSVRTVAVILCLMELGGTALGDRFAFREIAHVDRHRNDLRVLERNGLARSSSEQGAVDLHRWILWRGERWGVDSLAFAWWVRDVVISETRTVPHYNDWLNQKRYLLLLTQEQWDGLVSAARNTPEWAVRSLARFAKMILEEMGRP